MERLGTEQAWMAASGGRLAHDHLVDPRLVLLRADRAGGVALGIEVDEEDALARLGEVGAEIDGGGRLAHSPLLIRENDDLPHRKRNTPFSPC